MAPGDTSYQISEFGYADELGGLGVAAAVAGCLLLVLAVVGLASGCCNLSRLALAVCVTPASHIYIHTT